MLESPLVDKLIELALLEDLSSGDVTSKLTIDPNQSSGAAICPKQELVVCGTTLLRRIAEAHGSNLDIDLQFQDGEIAEPGKCIAFLSGNTISLLALERTFLNFLQRMCGIATYTKQLTDKASPLVLLDTRKTTPGWRALEKYAVRVGGGRNHRISLGDMVLVKDNHIDACGGIKEALDKITNNKPPYMPVEVEVRDLEEAKLAADYKPTIIMLDNMSASEMKEAIAAIKEASPQTQIEASGNINEERFAELNNIGVELASLSALTVKAPAADISMKIK